MTGPTGLTGLTGPSLSALGPTGPTGPTGADGAGPTGPTGSAASGQGALLLFSGLVQVEPVTTTHYLANASEVGAPGVPLDYYVQPNVTFSRITLLTRTTLTAGQTIAAALLADGVEVPGATVFLTGLAGAYTLSSIPFPPFTFANQRLDVRIRAIGSTSSKRVSVTIQS